ncbi:MAG: PAS domain S-box protein [Candidatus Lokiarchaeota archaeon]|nr:PAS domain S-box protein [Candidatus Lokiarchaeota archaeon]
MEDTLQSDLGGFSTASMTISPLIRNRIIMKEESGVSVDKIAAILQADLKSVWDAVTSLPRGIAIVDLSEDFIFVNDYMAEIIGYSKQELIGRSVLDFIDSSEIEEIQDQTSQRLEGHPSIYNVTMTHKTGECRILRVSAAPWRNADGKITGTVGIIDDVTEELAAQRALQASQERYKLLFEGAQEAITIETAEELITHANQAACELFGYSREELVGMNSRMLVAPEERSRPKHPVYKQDEGIESDVFELTVFTKAEKRIPVEISLGHLHSANQELFISFIRDISERKYHEEMQKQYERELELYTSIMRHDLSSDLQIALGYVELTLATLPEDDVKSRNRLQQSLDVGKQMANLLQTFTPTKKSNRLEIRQLLREIAEQSEKANANLTIEIEIDKSVKDTMAPSSRLLPIAFVNLFRNSAIHAGDSPTVRLTCKKKSDILEIFVSDDGPGIDPSIQERIFQKGISTRGGGLGLYLTRQIIQSLSGTIELIDPESATFKITLPV